MNERGAPPARRLPAYARAHLALTLALTCLTAWYSYAYFHVDEYFQVVQLTRLKLGGIDAWSLPWEHAARMRPWLQPGLYYVVARVMGALGASDLFVLAFGFRLVTGVACWAALVLFVRTVLPWFGSEDERRLFVRVAALLGFLPYLFVRTSSEALSMALFTAGFAALLARSAPEGAGFRLDVTVARAVACGVLFGLAFEARFQSAFLTLGLLAWLRVVGRAPWRLVGAIGPGGALGVGAGALVDRWGYGEWALTPWEYAKANLLEGAASLFGSDPPFAYVWLLPANVMAPVVAVLLALAVLAWVRHPRHPLTWTALPFFVVHNLLAHKEERFLFPLAILATALVPLAVAPGPARAARVAAWLWARRRGAAARALAAYNLGALALLALWPIGWHHHVPFTRHARARFGEELRVHALPDFDLGLPAYHPRVYDVAKAPPEDVLRAVEDGTSRGWLVADTPRLRTGLPALDARATLEWSELPVFRDAAATDAVLRVVDAYNARARPPLRPLTFRSLYRLSGGASSSEGARGRGEGDREVDGREASRHEGAANLPYP